MSWVHVVLDAPAAAQPELADFWGRVLGWPVGEPWAGHPELRSFTPPTGAPYVHLQRIDGRPRVHLDLESPEPEETVAMALRLGAGQSHANGEWTTLYSPGGLPFCVLPEREHDPPSPRTLVDGHRVRLVQVCIDAPTSTHEAEVAFWRALLGHRWVGSSAPEFAGKWHDDDGSPVQLLFQVLDEADGPVRAHLDLGTDDVAAEIQRLVRLGAEDVGPGRGWHVLRDVAGSLFCVTGNSPEQTQHRGLG